MLKTGEHTGAPDLGHTGQPALTDLSPIRKPVSLIIRDNLLKIIGAFCPPEDHDHLSVLSILNKAF